MRKYWRRGRLILANSLHSLVAIVFSPLVSYIVIRRGSLTLWGEFIALLLVVQLGAQLVGWGHKGYLLREFSQQPANVWGLWWQNVRTRMQFGLLFVLFLWWWGLPIGGGGILLWGVALIGYQAYDSLIVYRQRFGLAGGLEVCGLLILVLVVWFWPDSLTVRGLVWLWAAVLAGKLVIITMVMIDRESVALFSQSNIIDNKYWRLAFSFFLLGFSGMLQSRMDLYAVNYFLTREEVAQYQIFINYLLYVQALANFVLQPFVKSLYRLPWLAVMKMAGWLGLLGLLLIGPALLFLAWVLPLWYGFELPVAMLFWGGLYVWPVYIYLPIIYLVYKEKQERLVVGINVVGSAVNLVLNIILIPAWGILGALVATTIANLIIALFYMGWLWRTKVRLSSS